MRERTAIRPVTTVRLAGTVLALVAAVGLAGCAGSAGANGGYAGRDDLAARCARDHGVWRPEIAGGYCERKP
jgi:hypothetical protein